MTTAVDDRLGEIIAPLVASVDLELYDLEHTGGTLRVLVTGPDGVDVDRLGDLTRRISVALDAADPIPGRYTLEVSSPGLERPLRTSVHFAGAVGETITVRTGPGEQGRRRVRGELLSADAGLLVIADAEAGGEPVEVPLAEVETARTVFEWGPAGRPTRTKKGTAR